MIRLLKSIPGPQFLFIFPLLVILLLVAARLLMRSKDPAVRHYPDPSSFSPAAIAALNGGWQMLLKTVLFSLWQQDSITLLKDEENSSQRHSQSKVRFRRSTTSRPPTDRLELAIWTVLKTEKSPADLLKDKPLRTFVEKQWKLLRSEFVRLHLLKSDEEKRQGWWITLIVLAVIYSIGGTKCALGLIYHRPTGFLIVMLIVALPIVLLVLKPWQSLTPRGREYQRRLQDHFAWMKTDMESDQPPGINSAYAIAVFGTTILLASPLYASFGTAFPIRSGMSSSDSGMNGSSSSCGGGGCSGGCGGGCGGCGGD